MLEGREGVGDAIGEPLIKEVFDAEVRERRGLADLGSEGVSVEWLDHHGSVGSRGRGGVNDGER